jgi:lipopolysaccharide cholinephosphotransferase
MLTDIQIKLSAMLKDLVVILDENQIEYYIVGGTLLGAIRHKGFIPWDDDIDLSFPRQHFEYLIRNAQRLLPSYYKIESQSTNESFPYFYAKMYDTRTTLIENFTPPLVRGIYIDIFPLDGITNDSNLQIKKINQMKFYLNIYRRWHTKKISPLRLWHKVRRLLLTPLIKVLYSRTRLSQKICRIQREFSWQSTEYIVNYLGAWHEKEIQPKQWYQHRTQYQFNDFKVWGPRDYDPILTRLYGDYMSLPHIESRRSHHKSSYINLELPYKDYQYKI